MSLYAIDGTWNDERSGEVAAHTNVLDFAKAYAGIGAERLGQVRNRCERLRKEAAKPAEHVVELVAAEGAHLLEDQRGVNREQLR